MIHKIKIYSSFVLFLTGILFFTPALAITSLPAGGTSLGTAVSLSPGQYQGGALLSWQDPFYYSVRVGAGQQMIAEARSFAQSGCTVSLYGDNQEELTFSYDTNPKIIWLANADKSVYTYYLKISNDASDVSSFTLSVALTNYYDAGSSTDAGATFDQALTIAPGTYTSYLTGYAGITDDVGDDWQDVYKIGLQKGVTYEFKVTPPSKTTLDLKLYDANRQLLKEESSANAGAIVTLSLIPAANTNIFLSVINSGYSYQDALVNYKLEANSSVPLTQFYACNNQECEVIGEFSSKSVCQQSTTKTCYSSSACDGQCNSSTSTTKTTIVPTTTPSVCENECALGETKCFDNFNYYKCGDYNKDDCLDWGSPVYCGEGNKCASGKCSEAKGCQCSQWQGTECGVAECAQDQMAKTRICLPVACDVEKMCIEDESCSGIIPPFPIGGWWLFVVNMFGRLAWFGALYSVLGLLGYIYLAVSLQVLAKKTGTENGWMAWIPIADIFLMINIAKKPLWWFILLLIPIVNIVIGIILWMAIAERRGKEGWIGILLIVPIVGIAVPGYLAFFDAKKGEKVEITPPYVSTGTEEANKPIVGYQHPCKYCSVLIPPNSIVCPLCGKSNPLGPSRCPKCHDTVEKDWQACSHCGQNLRIVCPKCGKITFFGDYCEDCGERLLITCPHCGQEQPPLSNKCIKCSQLLKEPNK
ncbi:MAG: zinc ribbon domain-containing protein [Candidatus Parcubacteria bacterium]|nr:zinc ribbon domain-containing protein [Candidatus Parcubacteria bacterium]